MRRASIWAACAVMVACGGRTDALDDGTELGVGAGAGTGGSFPQGSGGVIGVGGSSSIPWSNGGGATGRFTYPPSYGGATWIWTGVAGAWWAGGAPQGVGGTIGAGGRTKSTPIFSGGGPSIGGVTGTGAAGGAGGFLTKGTKGPGGAGGASTTRGGATGQGGSSGQGGAIPLGGTFSKGGTPGFGGTSNVAGTFSKGGTPGFGGTSNVGGTFSKGGTPGFGGTSNVGGTTSTWTTATGGTTQSSVIDVVCSQVATNACQRCLCNTCADRVVTCVTDAQCLSVVACVAQTNCITTATGCYSPSTCRSVIDAAGGITGPGTLKALSMAGCMLTSACGC